MSYSHLDPGRELEICGHLYSNQMDLSELVQLPPAELCKREEASVEQEKAIYAKMLEIEKGDSNLSISESTAIPESTPYPAHLKQMGEGGV